MAGSELCLCAEYTEKHKVSDTETHQVSDTETLSVRYGDTKCLIRRHTKCLYERNAEILTVAQPIMIFPALHKVRGFITLITRARYWFLTQARKIQPVSNKQHISALPILHFALTQNQGPSPPQQKGFYF